MQNQHNMLRRCTETAEVLHLTRARCAVNMISSSDFEISKQQCTQCFQPANLGRQELFWVRILLATTSMSLQIADWSHTFTNKCQLWALVVILRSPFEDRFGSLSAGFARLSDSYGMQREKQMYKNFLDMLSKLWLTWWEFRPQNNIFSSPPLLPAASSRLYLHLASSDTPPPPSNRDYFQ